MPQTLGKQLERSVLTSRSLDPSEYEEMAALNKVIKANEVDDPNIMINRALTTEQNQYDKTKRIIDNNSMAFAGTILDTDGKTVRSDLSNQEITELKKQLPKHMEHLRSNGNPYNDPEINSYINGLGVKYAQALNSAANTNQLMDSLNYVEGLINNLGDEGRMDGTYSYANTEFLIENIKKAQGQNLSVAGENITDHYKPLLEKLEKKQYVLDALKHWTQEEVTDLRFEDKGSMGWGKDTINSSPKALQNLNEAIRIMRTSGDEDIDRAEQLLKDIPKFIGERGKSDLNDANKSIVDNKNNKLDEIESVGQALNDIASSYYKDDLDANIQEKMGFKFTNWGAGVFKSKKGREIVSKDTRTKMKSLLKGVEDFNEDISFENKDYASDLNIYKMLRGKNPNMNQIVRYFTDERPVQTDDGEKSLGYMRIQQMDTGNEDENMFFRDMMTSLVDLEYHIRKQDPIDEALLLDEAQKLSKRKEDAKNKLQAILEMRKKQNVRQKG